MRINVKRQIMQSSDLVNLYMICRKKMDSNNGTKQEYDCKVKYGSNYKKMIFNAEI